MQKKSIIRVIYILLALGSLSCLPSCDYIKNRFEIGVIRSDMNLVVEVSVPDMLESLAGYHATDSVFTSALAIAKEKQRKDSTNFVDLFVETFKSSGHSLQPFFACISNDDEAANVLKEKIKYTTDNTIYVLRSRLEMFDIKQFDVNAMDIVGRISIQLRGAKDPERICRLITSSANLEFWETAPLTEYISSFSDINEMVREIKKEKEPAPSVTDEKKNAIDSLFASTDYEKEDNPLYEVFFPSFGSGTYVFNTPSMGAADSKDTAIVSEYFRLAKEKNIFPSYIYPTWSLKSYEETDTYELVALRGKAGLAKAALSGNLIKGAEAYKEETSMYACVNFEMTPEASIEWADLTRNNVGNSIAIVLNGRVCCYPRVNQEITGGRCEVTGSFTLEEAEDIATVLNSSKLPASLKIIEKKIIEKPKL